MVYDFSGPKGVYAIEISLYFYPKDRNPKANIFSQKVYYSRKLKLKKGIFTQKGYFTQKWYFNPKNVIFTKKSKAKNWYFCIFYAKKLNMSVTTGLFFK